MLRRMSSARQQSRRAVLRRCAEGDARLPFSLPVSLAFTSSNIIPFTTLAIRRKNVSMLFIFVTSAVFALLVARWDIAGQFGTSQWAADIISMTSSFSSEPAALEDAAPNVAALLSLGAANLTGVKATVREKELSKITLNDGSQESIETILIQQILAKEADTRIYWTQHMISEAPVWSYSIMWNACQSGNDTVARLLIKSGLDLDISGSYDDLYLDYMHQASINGHIEIVKILHEAGYPMFDAISEFFGTTPLISAVKNQRVDCVQYLLQEGADSSKKDAHHNVTVTDWAARFGNVTTFDLLIGEGSKHGLIIESPNHLPSGQIGVFTLGNAAMSGSLAMIKRVLEIYADSPGKIDENISDEKWKSMVMEAFLASETEEILDHLLNSLLLPMLANGTVLEDAEFDFMLRAAAHVARRKSAKVLQQILDITLLPQHQKPTRANREEILHYVLINLCETQLIFGDTEAVMKLLVITYGANPQYLSPDGTTALYHATAHGDHGDVAPGFEYGIHSRNIEQLYPAYHRGTQILAMISDPDVASGKFANGPTALWLAVWGNAYYTTMILLENNGVLEYIDPEINEDTEWLWITAARTYRCPVKIYAGTYLSALTSEERQELQADLEAQNARMLVMDRVEKHLDWSWLLDRDVKLWPRRTDEEIAELGDPRELRVPSQDEIDALGVTLKRSYRFKKTEQGPVDSDFPDKMYWSRELPLSLGGRRVRPVIVGE